MPPERSRPRHIDVAHRQAPAHRRPEYRADHELAAPPPRTLIREHEPETPQAAQVAAAPAEEPVAAPDEQTSEPALEDIQEEEPKKPRKRPWPLVIGVIAAVAVIIAAASGYAWYQGQLSPLSTDTTKHVRVTISSGSTPSVIADELQK